MMIIFQAYLQRGCNRRRGKFRLHHGDYAPDDQSLPDVGRIRDQDRRQMETFAISDRMRESKGSERRVKGVRTISESQRGQNDFAESQRGQNDFGRVKGVRTISKQVIVLTPFSIVT